MAKLLDVDVEAVKDALTSRTVSAGGDIISAKHSAEKAEHGRDGFAKAIYERLFSFIVGKINSKIQVAYFCILQLFILRSGGEKTYRLCDRRIRYLWL